MHMYIHSLLYHMHATSMHTFYTCQLCRCRSILLLCLIVCYPSFFALSPYLLTTARKPCPIRLIAYLKYSQLLNNSKPRMLPFNNLYLSFSLPHPQLPQPPHSTHCYHPKNPTMNPKLAFLISSMERCCEDF